MRVLRTFTRKQKGYTPCSPKRFYKIEKPTPVIDTATLRRTKTVGGTLQLVRQFLQGCGCSGKATGKLSRAHIEAIHNICEPSRRVAATPARQSQRLLLQRSLRCGL